MQPPRAPLPSSLGCARAGPAACSAACSFAFPLQHFCAKTWRRQTQRGWPGNRLLLKGLQSGRMRRASLPLTLLISSRCSAGNRATLACLCASGRRICSRRRKGTRCLGAARGAFLRFSAGCEGVTYDPPVWRPLSSHPARGSAAWRCPRSLAKRRQSGDPPAPFRRRDRRRRMQMRFEKMHEWGCRGPVHNSPHCPNSQEWWNL